MTKKRYRKISGVLEEVPAPRWVGPKKEIDVGVLSWGSTAGAAYEAVMQAREKGINAAFMSSMLISPLPIDHLKKFSDQCKHLVVPELNHTGQYAAYISQYLERKIIKHNMVTGLPMYSEDILEKICEIDALAPGIK